MAQDCFVINGTAKELDRRLKDARIDKIYMPAKDKILMTVRAAEGNIRLLLEAGNIGKVHITKQKFENPDTPPMFCMLLRKHLASGRIVSVRQPFFERMMEITFTSADEMGNVTEKYIYIEMMGRRNNIIFVGSDRRILGCLKKIDMDMSQDRPVLPGLIYEYPPKQDKVNIVDDSLSAITEVLPVGECTHQMLLDRIAGISPAIAKEICYKSQNNGTNLLDEIIDFRHLVTDDKLYPVNIVKDEKVADFSAFEFEYLKNDSIFEKTDGFSEMLDAFYFEKNREEQKRNASSQLHKFMTNAYERQQRKIANQKNELIVAQNRDELKKKADLIMSNLHLIKKGMKEATLIDYYDEAMPEIKIELDELKTPHQNAQKLYDQFGKLKNAEIMLRGQIEKGEQELEYISSVVTAIENAEGVQDINAIKDELVESGYIRVRNNVKNPKKKKIDPRKYITSDGFLVLCGRNNVENDALTMKQADFKDIWLHAKDVPGSHTIIVRNGREVSDIAIEEAAKIAAYYSKMAKQSLAAIDYTMVKYVKKIPGGKPGMVTYTNYKTVFVKPELIKEA